MAQAAPERVAALVYLAGMMLPSGQGFGDIIASCERENPSARLDGIAPYLDYSADRSVSSVRLEGALTCFLHDCEPAAALQAAGRLRPQQETGRLMKPLLTADRFGTVPRIYVECGDDRSVFLALQRKMQALTPGATRVSMDCGHVPQLVRPAELAERLGAALRAVLSGGVPAPRC